MAKVRRSRRSWMNSLTNGGAERGRRTSSRPHPKLSVDRLIRWMNTSSSVGSSRRHCCAPLWRSGAIAASSAAGVAAADVQRRAERRHHVDARRLPQALGEPGEIGAGHRAGGEMRVARPPPRPCPAPAARRRRCRRSRGSARPRPCSGWRRARSCPRAASAWISSQKSRRAFGSTPAVGSSSSRSSGSCRMQAPSARRCFQPPESVAGELVGAIAEPEPLDRGLGGRRAASAGRRRARRSRGSRGSRGPRRARSAASCSRRGA